MIASKVSLLPSSKDYNVHQQTLYVTPLSRDTQDVFKMYRPDIHTFSFKRQQVQYPMKTIYLVRHCQYDNPRNIYPGRLPVQLSAAGIEEAERLRKFFADKEIEKIYSSAVHRCKQTSETIADKKIPVIFDKRLLETFSAYQGFWGAEFGTPEGWDEFYAHREELGGEGYEDVQKRALAAVREIASGPEEKIIICSHGDPLQFIYLGLSNKKMPYEIGDTGEYGNPDYLRKGWIRPLYFDNNEYRFEPIITQDTLAELYSTE